MKLIPINLIINILFGLLLMAWRYIPLDQKKSLLIQTIEKNIGAFLGDFERKEQAKLMNTLAPLAAREFPLSELNILDIFGAPGDRYAP